MNPSQLPVAIRATAAALAVFMTFAMLNSMIAIAEPQQSELIAQTTARRLVQAASAPQAVTMVAQGATATTHR